ncbi:hypothetical protein [Acinetobacter sp. ANC 5045]|uniref:hypothetical protein n=1 Tax=Acinetobacter sp. ANC 5045 TaxID=2529851 RepID=UPI0010406334|nr:hypothetical protein [Acinetobacter sp. ANC 5045]TCB12268.1 hypothetical protein E0H79_14670 [Acinetobacter sp. ANC 5045]
MSYIATVIPVMIASPGDVLQEREEVRKAIYNWNDINSKNTSMILNPIGWETHGAPEMGDRAQALINKRLLNECDLLIAVFWTRIGTPTGGYESGTVEEIERHMAEGKPTMIYFSKTPIDYSAVDRDQYDLLMKKKDEWKNKGRIEEFSSLQEFKDKLNKQLPYLLSTHEYILSCSSSIPNAQQTSDDSSVTLSSEAVEIIQLAGSTDGGIMKLRHMAGLLFQVGGENLDTSTPRKEATYVAALDELLNYGLVEAKGNKGQIYNLTKYGWDAYDKIMASNS